MTDKQVHFDKNNNVDTEHFLRLLTPVQGRIYGYILSRWPNRNDADDIMQEAICTIWSKFDRYEPGTNFLAWALVITKYTILSYRRKHKNKQIQFNDQAIKMIEDTSKGFFEKMDARLVALQDCVKKLPMKESQLLKMRYERELPVKRIAFRMDVSARAIYKALSRIHDALIRCVRLTLATEEIL